MNEIERIYLLLQSFLGTSKQGGYDSTTTQYQFNCPSCADEKGAIDNKYNLEVSLALDKMQFHCWSCGISGTLSKLIKMYGTHDLVVEYFSLIDGIRKSRLYDITLFTGHTESEIFRPALSLPKTFKKVDLKNCDDKRVSTYLISRGIDQNIIDTYNIGYTSWDETLKGFKCRIIVPSYDEFGVLNFFVGRDYLPENKNGFKRPKYKNCEADKKDIVFNEELIDWDSTIYLCEGIFDSLVYENAVPLMGKYLDTDFYLYKKLVARANGDVVIALDSDTKPEETMELYRLLNSTRLKNKIKYIYLGTDNIPYKDFSQIYEFEGKSGLIKTFAQTKQYEEIDLIYDKDNHSLRRHSHSKHEEA